MFQVLVVEDDPGIRGLLRMLLEAQQYRVVEAESGQRGAIEARSHRPDLVIVDLGLSHAERLGLLSAFHATADGHGGTDITYGTQQQQAQLAVGHT